MILPRRLFFAFLLGLAMPVIAAPTPNFTGRYELAKRTSKAFALEVVQKEGKAEISFSAGNEDGSGAAPDGDGAGRLNAQGELTFSFTDSFGNTGTAVLRSAGAGFRLTMKLDKVEEPRAVIHYGILVLKRTSTKPKTTER